MIFHLATYHNSTKLRNVAKIIKFPFLDIDECISNNGDCEQHCINKPGSYDCGCEVGLQIETTNGKTCIGM